MPAIAQSNAQSMHRACMLSSPYAKYYQYVAWRHLFEVDPTGTTVRTGLCCSRARRSSVQAVHRQICFHQRDPGDHAETAAEACY